LLPTSLSSLTLTFFHLLRPHPIFLLFPYTTLFRSLGLLRVGGTGVLTIGVLVGLQIYLRRRFRRRLNAPLLAATAVTAALTAGVDRKSTRLNSSHVSISYAVFCLKKKNTSIYKN